MRVLHVTNNYTPYASGVVSSINAFTHSLQKSGHEVTIATLSFLADHSDDPNHVYRLSCPIRFSYKTNHIAAAYRPYAQLKKLIKNERPDIVHVHHPFYLGAYAARAAKEAGIPVVFTYHSQYEQYAHYLPLPKKLLKKIMHQRIKNFLKNVDHIFAPSRDIQKYIEITYKHPSISVLPSPIQDYFFQDKHIKSIHPDKPFKLLYVGRLTKEKNIPFLLHLMQKLNKNMQLQLIGYGALEEYLKNYAYQKLKLDLSRVQFIHKPAQHELPKYYRDADLFVFSSITETQGLVLAEAMAASRPVVALKGAGQNDIIQSAINGFLVDNETEMMNAIEEIAQNNNLYAQLQEGAYKTAQTYQADKLVLQLISFYQKVAGF